MITSAQNPQIKHIAQLLDKSRTRRAEGLFVVEGQREVAQALENGFHARTVYTCPALLPQPLDVLPALAHVKVEEVEAHVYEKVAYRGTTEGILAVMEAIDRTPQDLILSPNPLIIVLEAVEKPGNLGAILRTADAVHADALLVCDPLTDLYNPNTLRASLGCAFSVPTVACTSAQACDWLCEHQIQRVAANCQSDLPFYKCNFTVPTAVVMGTEDKGLTTFWRQNASVNVKIPMLGRADSLNVSVATAVLCYEIIRQRLSL